MINVDSVIAIRPIMGVDIASATAAEISRLIDVRVANNDVFPVAFANANLLTLARGDRDLREKLASFLVLNDGLGTDLASMIIYGEKFRANLNGTDFLPFFLRNSTHSFRIFILGGQEGVASASMLKLAEAYPRHQFVGCHHGYFPSTNNQSVLDKIRGSNADLVLVGLGNPIQEAWLARNLRASGCKLGFAVGAFIDFSSGRIARAPQAVRTLRVEWLFRFLLEPRRLFKRYTVGSTSFILLSLLERFRGNAEVRVERPTPYRAD